MSDGEIEIGITVKGRIMGVAEYGAFMNAAGQVAVNSAPYVAGHCFFNALENALRYRQPTKVLQLGTGGDSDWRKRYRRTMRLRYTQDGGSYDVNSALHLEHKPLSNSGARLVDWSRRYDVLELSKVRRQVAVVQRAAAFLDGEPIHRYSQVREKERGREEEEEGEKKKRKKGGKRRRRKRKKVLFFLMWEVGTARAGALTIFVVQRPILKI